MNMKFECKWTMEVDDLELLEMVNDWQDNADEPQYNTLDDVPEQTLYDVIYDSYLEEEINDYLLIEDINVQKL